MRSPRTPAARLDLKLQSEKAYLRSLRDEPIARLPGFDRRKHRIPDKPQASADAWVKRLLEESIRRETLALYQSAKRAFSLSRDEMERSAADGLGSVEAPPFYYTVEAGQSPEDPSEARVERRLFPRMASASLPAEFDTLFPVAFREVVVPITGKPGFDELVRKFEALARKAGGELVENEDDGSLRYGSRDGLELLVRAGEGLLILRPIHPIGCLALMSAFEHGIGREPRARRLPAEARD
jgi:hypothetical protein